MRAAENFYWGDPPTPSSKFFTEGVGWGRNIFAEGYPPSPLFFDEGVGGVPERFCRRVHPLRHCFLLRGWGGHEKFLMRGTPPHQLFLLRGWGCPGKRLLNGNPCHFFSEGESATRCSQGISGIFYLLTRGGSPCNRRSPYLSCKDAGCREHGHRRFR